VQTASASLCGYPFKAEREYLIYAVHTEDGRLATTICSRTAPIERAAEDLRYARNAVSGIVPVGRIVGDVRVRTAGRRTRGVSNVIVNLAAGGVVNSTVTDNAGRYSIELSSAGRHALTVDLPDTQYPIQPRYAIDVLDPHACVERDIDVAFNGRIAGRIIEANGRGLAGLPVVNVSTATTNRTAQRTAVLTRDDGTYDMARLPPGPFQVRIDIPVGAGDAGAGFLGDEASVVAHGTLGEGESRSAGTFTVPRTFQVVRLEGVVVGADGWSLPDARVFLKGASRERIVGVPAVTDALGRFVLALAAEEQYYVFAERSSGDAEFSEPVSITAEDRMAPLRLVVRRRF
jgi:hypothetical protein